MHDTTYPIIDYLINDKQNIENLSSVPFIACKLCTNILVSDCNLIITSICDWISEKGSSTHIEFYECGRP